MVRRGRFVVLEGGEGSGKSTQARLLADHLGAVLTREPGGTALGEQIRSVLLDPGSVPVEARAELLLMVAARAQHVAEVIVPALEGGRDVVSDRFSGSTVAYQGYGRGLPLDEVGQACRLAAGNLEPDLVVLLDVPPAVAEARRDRDEDRIEGAGRAFHGRVRDGFLCLARAAVPTWAVLDGSGTVDEVSRAVRSEVKARLGGAGGGER